MKILFLTRSLEYGGAERQIEVLARGLQQRGHEVRVVSFYTGGSIQDSLVQAGVPVIPLGKRLRFDIWGFFLRLFRYVRAEQPDILHGFLPFPNILALALRRVAPRARVVWGVRSCHTNLGLYDWLERAFYWLECRLSRFPDCIIANSRAGMRYAVSNGFPADRFQVIPNGIDTDRFVPDRSAGAVLRRDWGVQRDEMLVGLVARLDPVKDHPTFLEMAARLATARKDVRFVCVGGGPEAYRTELQQMAERLGVADRVTWAGPRTDMVKVYNALDNACLCSMAESFPNAVGEAMACGVPCVVTDVGDAAWMVGDPSRVAPAKDPSALAERLADVLREDRAAAGARARQRIVECFGVSRLIERTERLLRELCGEAVEVPRG